MDFRLTEGQRLVRDTARDFVDRELIPHVRDWEEKGEVPRSFYRKMAGLGFLGAPVPEKYGGAGMDYVSFMLLVEEISRGSSSVRTTVSVQTSLSETSLMWFGSEGQKEKGLVALAEGEGFGAWASTEPEGGGGGVARAALEAASKYVQERKAFGRPIGDFQLVREMIAQSAVEIDAARLLTLRAAHLRDLGQDNTLEVSMAKLYGAQMAQRVTDWAVQVHGGYGVSGEFDVERYFRDAPILGEGKEVSGALRASGIRCEAVSFYLANGKEAGQEVVHTHMHVIPRWRGDGLGLRVRADRGRVADRMELDALAAKIRAAMGRSRS